MTEVMHSESNNNCSRCQTIFRCLLMRGEKACGVWIVMAVLGLAPQFSFAGDYNDLVLEQVNRMPQGGRYSVSHFAKIRLQSSAHFESGKFFIVPSGRVSVRGDVSGFYQNDRGPARAGEACISTMARLSD